MYNFLIVILNYVNYTETINCVNDILKLDQDNININIVVVDNCSPNNSFNILQEQYKGNDCISVIKTQYNNGFARGNNFGVEYANKMQIKYDFIICANNDLLFPDTKLFSWIIDKYKTSNFGVLGPKVYSTRANFYQSPLPNYSTNIHTCKKILNEYKLKLIIYKIMPNFMYKLLKISNNACFKNSNYVNEQENVTLHGALLIFSSNYYKNYKNIFDEGTFLYMQEDIIKLRCNRKNIKILYSPEYEVLHLHSFSTNSNNEKIKTKKISRIKNQMEALKRYIEVLSEKE